MIFQFDNRSYEILVQETVTVSTTAIGFTVANLTNSTDVVVRINDQDLRFRTDGTDPTAASGWTSEPGDLYVITTTEEAAAFKAIRTGGTDSEIDVMYLRRTP